MNQPKPDPLYDRYEEHAARYAVFDMPIEQLTPLVQPLSRRRVRPKYVSWLALKWAGSFFAYDRPVVWVWLTNNRTNSEVNRRHDHRGFYVTITTYDDCALYGDWKDPLDDDTMAKVIDYFDKMPRLMDYKTTCRDLNRIIGVEGDICNS
jgi:hypothetical protein